MSKSQFEKSRSLGTIEADMLQASDELAEAEDALKEVQQKRDGLLLQINELQEELDAAVNNLRSKCPPGSSWSDKGSPARGTLNLDEASVVNEPKEHMELDASKLILPHRSQEVSQEFEKLRRHVIEEVREGKITTNED